MKKIFVLWQENEDDQTDKDIVFVTENFNLIKEIERNILEYKEYLIKRYLVENKIKNRVYKETHTFVIDVSI